MRAVWLLFAAVLAFSAASDPNTEFSTMQIQAHSDFKQFVGFLQDAMEGEHTGEFVKESLRPLEERAGRQKRSTSVNKFVFQNCAPPTSEIVVPYGVSLKPDPIKLPGNVTAGGSVLIKKPVTSPVKLALEIEIQKLGLWIKVPCVDNVGSCTYNDLCKMIKVKKCPPAILKAGLKCKCPLPKGKFSVAAANLYVKASLPVSGAFRVTARASSGEQLLTCINIQFHVEKGLLFTREGNL